MPSPTEKSLALLRAQGYTAEVVEKWLHGPKLRKDLYGFIDILGMLPTTGFTGEPGHILAVQATTIDHYHDHVSKLLDKKEALLNWLLSGGKFAMWCWGEGKEGKMKWSRLKISQANYSWTGKRMPYKPRLEWFEEEILNPMRQFKGAKS